MCIRIYVYININMYAFLHPSLSPCALSLTLSPFHPPPLTLPCAHTYTHTQTERGGDATCGLERILLNMRVCVEMSAFARKFFECVLVVCTYIYSNKTYIYMYTERKRVKEGRAVCVAVFFSLI